MHARAVGAGHCRTACLVADAARTGAAARRPRLRARQPPVPLSSSAISRRPRISWWYPAHSGWWRRPTRIGRYQPDSRARPREPPRLSGRVGPETARRKEVQRLPGTARRQPGRQVHDPRLVAAARHGPAAHAVRGRPRHPRVDRGVRDRHPPGDARRDLDRLRRSRRSRSASTRCAACRTVGSSPPTSSPAASRPRPASACWTARRTASCGNGTPAPAGRRSPGSEAAGANGIEISNDGKWYYVAAWGSQSFFRLSRNGGAPVRDEIRLGFRVDNIRWARDGSLLAAGQASSREQPDTSSVIVKINPDTLTVREVYRRPDDAVFRAGTVAVEVGDGSLGRFLPGRSHRGVSRRPSWQDAADSASAVARYRFRRVRPVAAAPRADAGRARAAAHPALLRSARLPRRPPARGGASPRHLRPRVERRRGLRQRAEPGDPHHPAHARRRLARASLHSHRLAPRLPVRVGGGGRRGRRPRLVAPWRTPLPRRRRTHDPRRPRRPTRSNRCWSA